MSQLAPMIERLRKERGLSLQKVADGAQLTKAHVWELERGTSQNPSVNTLVGLGSVLGVSAVELFRAAISSPLPPG